MIRRNSQLLCVWFLSWDLALTAAAWVGAYYLRFESGWVPQHKSTPDFALCWRNLPLVILLAAVSVGTGRVARKTPRALRHANWMGIKNLGFVEDQSSHWAGDLDVLGTTADLPRLIEQYTIGHVFIALPLSRYPDARRVFDVLS